MDKPSPSQSFSGVCTTIADDVVVTVNQMTSTTEPVPVVGDTVDVEVKHESN